MELDKVIEFALKVNPDFQACKEDMYESLLGIEVVAAFAALVFLSLLRNKNPQPKDQ